MCLCRESDTVLWHFNTLVRWKINDFIKTVGKYSFKRIWSKNGDGFIILGVHRNSCVSAFFLGHQLITQIKTEQIPKEYFSHFPTQRSPEGSLVASSYL